MTDTERLDWLSTQKHTSISEVRHTGAGGPDQQTVAYQDGMRVQMFTVASQHVYGTDLRNAIDVAMTKVRLVGAVS